jgi:Tol biopolymer transport system component
MSLAHLVTGVLFVSTLTVPARAQVTRLNGLLATESRRGSVSDHLFTADGALLVYRADRAADGLHELFSTPADGSGPSVRLNEPLAPGGSVSTGIQIGAGNRVAYVAAKVAPSVPELFVVPADGSATPLLVAPGPLAKYGLDPAGDHAYFRAQTSLTTLRRVRLDGTTGPSVVATFAEIPLQLRFSDDGSRVLVRTFGPGGSEDLYSVPADGSGPPLLLHRTGSGNLLNAIRAAPDGVHGIFEEVQLEGVFFPNFLLGAPLDGGAPSFALSTDPLYQSQGYALESGSTQGRLAYQEDGGVFSIAFDGTQRAPLVPAGWEVELGFFGAAPILAVRGQDVVFEAVTATGRALLRAPLDGSQLGTPLSAPTPATALRDPEILPTGAVLYRALGASGTALQAVPLAGGTPLVLAPPQVPNRGVLSFQANGVEAVFVSDVTGKEELFRAPLDASQSPRRLNAPFLHASADVLAVTLTGDGLAAAYLADPVSDQRFGLFRAPLDGLGPVTQYNEPVPGSAIGGDVLEFRYSRGAERVVYRADEDQDESFELYAVRPSGRGGARRLTATPTGAHGVRPGFALSGSGERVLYQSLESSGFVLRSAPIGPGPALVALDESSDEFPLPLAITADGTRAVHRRLTNGIADAELRSVPLDGSAPAFTLHPALAAGRTVAEFQLAPFGGRVVYRADASLDGVDELFSVPVDGSAPPVRLHPPLAAGRRVTSFRIAPDGRRVVFLADREVAGRFDLYSAPLDASFPARKLDPLLEDTRDVSDFVIAPDGRSVVYRANVVDASQPDLFLVPIDGPGPYARSTGSGATRHDATRLLSVLPSPHRVEADYAFSPDGSALLFRANGPFGSNRFDLFRVPADGSAAPVRLSEAQAGTRTVSAFAVARDSSRVAYLSDSAANDVFELYSVSLAGGAVSRLDPLPAAADVSSFRIDPGSERVVYLVDRMTDGVPDLHEVPLDGSEPARRLTGPLPSGGAVELDYQPLAGERTLFRADMLESDRVELFSTVPRPVLPE